MGHWYCCYCQKDIDGCLDYICDWCDTPMCPKCMRTEHDVSECKFGTILCDLEKLGVIESCESWKDFLSETHLKIESHACKMYETYCKAVDWKSTNGDDLTPPDIFFLDKKYKKQADAWKKVASIYVKKLEEIK